MPETYALNTLPTAGLGRRLLAAAYDLLLIMAIWLVAGFVAMPVIVSFEVHPGNPYFRAYLFFVTFAFFAWFWMRGGATLGMRAWRLRLIQPDGHRISLSQAMLRFVVSFFSWLLLGAGFLWMLIDKEKCTWHDRLSGTKVVLLPKVE